MKRFASYGSLRKGFWNHTRFGLGEPILTTVIAGAMFMDPNLGYPWLFDGQDHIFPSNQMQNYPIEVYEVSEEIYDRINSMEINSGYREVIHVIQGIPTTLWFADWNQIHPSEDQWISDYQPTLD